MSLGFFAFALLLCPFVAGAAGHQSAALTKDDSGLVLTATDGARFDAPGFPDQVGYSQPHIAPDGKYVGWLALYPNDGTSYPIPLKLVVLDQSRHLHTFTGIDISIFSWCFMQNSTAVMYMQSPLHFSDYRHFELRRLRDGRLLAKYDDPGSGANSKQVRKPAPAWVRQMSDRPGCGGNE
ncbi:MAG: hypothetical protein V4634_20145 [Pseudomonadota bacterium]